MRLEKKQKNIRSERLGNEPIKNLILSLFIPSSIGLILGSSYNLVDTYFVAKLGVSAITALSVAFPIQMILTGIATGVGVGSQSVISRLLGKGETRDAMQAAGSSILLASIFGIFTLIIGVFFTEFILQIFINDTEIIALGASYLRIILIGSISLFFLRAGINILRAQGNYNLPMMILLLTVILNIILDPLFIFGYLGFPALGVEGAALATVLSKIIGCIIVTGVLFTEKNEVKIRFTTLRWSSSTIASILSIGIPTIMIQLVMGITIAGVNKILEGLTFATVAIAIVGINFKLQSLFLMPILALNQSLVPIIGYNYGLKNHSRLKETMKIATLVAFFVSLFGFIIFQLLPGQLISVFNDDTMLVTIGIDAFRRINLFLFIIGPAVVFISFFQAIGKIIVVFIAILIRQFFAFFPVFYVLTQYYGHPILWFAFPIADISAITIGFILALPYFRRLHIIRIFFPWKKDKYL